MDWCVIRAVVLPHSYPPTPQSFPLSTMQSGSLPSDIASVMSLTGYSGMLDIRLNFMCCCGVGPLIGDVYAVDGNNVT